MPLFTPEPANGIIAITDDSSIPSWYPISRLVWKSHNNFFIQNLKINKSSGSSLIWYHLRRFLASKLYNLHLLTLEAQSVTTVYKLKTISNQIINVNLSDPLLYIITDLYCPKIVTHTGFGLSLLLPQIFNKWLLVNFCKIYHRPKKACVYTSYNKKP